MRPPVAWITLGVILGVCGANPGSNFSNITRIRGGGGNSAGRSFHFQEIERVSEGKKWPKFKWQYNDPKKPPEWLKVPTKVVPGLPSTKPPPVPKMIPPPMAWGQEGNLGQLSSQWGADPTGGRWIPIGDLANIAAQSGSTTT
ncbi:hypothetical protein AAMO2058_001094300 [Amorphochlora amoebiformis]